MRDRIAFENELRNIFSGIAVYKDVRKNGSVASLGIPSFLRDWLTMRFADENGSFNVDEVRSYAKKTIPKRDQWEKIKSEMVKEHTPVRFLAKIRVEIDVKSGEGLFSLPDFGFPRRKYEAVIEDNVFRQKREMLLNNSDAWGVVQLEWRFDNIYGHGEQGVVFMTDFEPFRPYKVDLDFFQEVRGHFDLEEWIDIIIGAIDYNPAGFISDTQKFALLTRLLPFVEGRVNLIELAPKGTGKSYLFSQISKYGWLVSGGSVSRARMFYDIARGQPGLISRNDYVALDEIQSITFQNEEEMRGALKGYLENGEFRVGDYRGVANAGIMILGNIADEQMDLGKNMFLELPKTFHESALLDRFHGFLKGWDIPRMKESLKANGWALNSEYYSEIMHELRNDICYRNVVDEMLIVPKDADTRDTEAVKRLATGFLKIMFPNALSTDVVDRVTFDKFCLQPAMSMRAIIRKQLHLMDTEYSAEMPDIICSEA
jgi:ATP-dependent Lon protease